MYDPDHRQPAPDFTDAFLAMACVLVFVALCAIAAWAGYICVAFVTWAAHRVMDRWHESD